MSRFDCFAAVLLFYINDLIFYLENFQFCFAEANCKLQGFCFFFFLCVCVFFFFFWRGGGGGTLQKKRTNISKRCFGGSIKCGKSCNLFIKGMAVATSMQRSHFTVQRKG